ncbi:hypothetical protein RJ641_014838 [Dillenia turbinata]|uniref:Uncharacterized protein n=1 Tax=Dillenia turbinata TaxID=194707 RepID=A0AAN8UQ62_9MAGN
MALAINNGATTFTKTGHSRPQYFLQQNSSGSLSFSPLGPTRLVLVSATPRKLSSRTGKFDSKNKRNLNSRTTTTEEKEKEEEEKKVVKKEPEIRDKSASADAGVVVDDDDVDDGYFLPDLPGNEPDFWEGPQWEPLGFFVQYLWAFGIVFAAGTKCLRNHLISDSFSFVGLLLIACGIAVVTYNEGATDFKETPAYKESIQSRELLEEPESSNSDVFESNPTEEAPSLE